MNRYFSRYFFLYFVFLFVAYELSKQTGIYFLRALPATGLLVYTCVNLLYNQNVFRQLKITLFNGMLLLTFVGFISLSSLLNNSFTIFITEFITNLSVLSFSIIFFSQTKHVGINVFFKSILIAFILNILIPHLIIGDFSIGGHYNLYHFKYLPFAVNSIDAPVFSSIAVICSVYYFKASSRKSLVYIILFLAILEVLLINRRGPMLMLLVSPFFAFRRNSLLLPMILIFPLFWKDLIIHLMPVFTSDWFKILIPRSNPSNILEATNRIIAWEAAMKYLMKPMLVKDYILGLGDISRIMNNQIGDELLTHAHNGILQMFIDNGIIGLILFLTIISLVLKKIIGFNSWDVVILRNIVLFIIIASLFESLFMTSLVSFQIFLFILGYLFGIKKNAYSRS